MTSLSDGMLGSRLRGARFRRLQAPAPPSINSTCLFSEIWSPQIMSFTVQRSSRVPFLPGLEMGKLIVPLKQIGIIPLDALMSECERFDVCGLTVDGKWRSEENSGRMGGWGGGVADLYDLREWKEENVSSEELTWKPFGQWRLLGCFPVKILIWLMRISGFKNTFLHLSVF